MAAGAGYVTLGSIRAQAQERADMLNSTFLSTSEWNANIARSYKELYDLLIAAYGADYYVNIPIQFITDGTSFLFPLPNGTTTFTNGVTGATGYAAPAFYKLLGVDLCLSPGSTDSFVTLKQFNMADRNRYSVPNFQSFYGVTNMRYRLNDNNLWLTPTPMGGQTIQIWYIPRPSNIQQEVIATTTSASTTVTCSDTSNLAVGQLVQSPSPTTLFPSGTTISSITPNVSFVVSNAATANNTNGVIRAWTDSTQIDGVSGWEEYIVLDAALKAMGKEESDVSLIAQQKMAMKQRLIDMAANRDAGMAATVADVSSPEYAWPGLNGTGWGNF